MNKNYQISSLEIENQQLRDTLDQYQKREKNHFTNYVLFIFFIFLFVGMWMML
ncbi:hypothetical protein [Salinibacillus xinjiangensis]|uniref:Uncharacterized protein n=1 Tax=Salinibacillus xinjiangensis TaxID=1229268 RepID=A0A6G1X7V4_9BACI|nr:hypothetical protein [Salinibacillus xinjiangensis]MRG86985.1 hypothetical protein [Salinibacillus xinjiangensis]